MRVEARAEITRLRAAGYGTTEIANSLNRRGVPTPSGRGRWWPDTVRRHVDPIAAMMNRNNVRRYRARQRRP